VPLPDWALGVAVIIIAVALGKALRSLGQTLANRGVSRGAAGDPDVPQLRAELDEVRQPLSEVEERLDFTERLLAKQRETERLGPSR